MTNRIFTFAAAVFALLALTPPAHAVTIQWNLSGVVGTAFPSGVTVTATGFFDWNTSWNGTLTNPTGATYDLTVFNLPGSPSPFTFSSSNALQENEVSVNAGINEFSVFCSNCSPADELILAAGAPQGSATLDGSVTPLFLNGVSQAVDPTGPAFLSGEIKASSIAAPLPAALPMFGTALLALAGFAASRRVREKHNV